MPPKKCSMKVPPQDREQDLYKCFKKGIKVGYRVGAQNERRRAEQANQPPPLATLTIRQLGELARQYRIRNYGRLRAEELRTALTQAGYPLPPQ